MGTTSDLPCSLYRHIVHEMALSRLSSRIHWGFMKYEFWTLVLIVKAVDVLKHNIIFSCCDADHENFMNYFANFLPVTGHKMERMV